MSKRDFYFIDESGDPGAMTEYFIVGLMHVDDNSIKTINSWFAGFRFFNDFGKELKSSSLNPRLARRINSMLIEALNQKVIKATAVHLNKRKYQGYYWSKSDLKPRNGNPLFFRHKVIRDLMQIHHAKNGLSSQELEIVFDRFHSSESDEAMLRNYLRTDKNESLPRALHIIQADSRYLELLQLSDYIAGVVKNVVYKNRESELYNHIDVVELKK